jgi:methylmalonyl-CoA epimerase
MSGREAGRVVGIHHVAFAHPRGEQPHALLAAHLGLEVEHAEEADGFIERMLPAGSCYLQTLEATGPGVVERFVSKRGAALHHVAFTVEGLVALLEHLRSAGVPLLDERPRPGGKATMVAFIHPSAFGGLLVELVAADTTSVVKGAAD